MVCFDVLSRAILSQTWLVYFNPDLMIMAGSCTVAEAMQIIIDNLFYIWCACAISPYTLCLPQDYEICYCQGLVIVLLVSSLKASQPSRKVELCNSSLSHSISVFPSFHTQ